MTKLIKIGLAGIGTVGAGVYKHLQENRHILRERLGVEFEVVRIAVRDIAKARAVDVPPALLTADAMDLVNDPEIDVVVELMGGVDFAHRFVSSAVSQGKIVVTGNKALLAERGEEIFKLATEKRSPVFFEAAVAGGIPIIKALRESFVGNHIRSMFGILNGTSNYILTCMTDGGVDFQEALEEARRLGFAEADPTLDVNGWDAGHKAIILASLAYGFWVGSDNVFVEGIDKVTAEDIGFAKKLGYTIKHLAIIRADAGGEIEVRVHPALIPSSHVLASVSGSFNAVAVNGDIVGETLFYGRGAGQDPTTSSVLSDLAEAALATELPGPFHGFTPHGLYLKCKPPGEIESQFYLRMAVANRPGTLGKVATVLGDHGVGIRSVIQPESDDDSPVAPLVLMLHDATFGCLRTAVAALSALDCVHGEPSVLAVDHLNA